jgi:hypothetical protein
MSKPGSATEPKVHVGQMVRFGEFVNDNVIERPAIVTEVIDERTIHATVFCPNYELRGTYLFTPTLAKGCWTFASPGE